MPKETPPRATHELFFSVGHDQGRAMPLVCPVHITIGLEQGLNNLLASRRHCNG
jgi:hypothetical protein